MSGALNGKWVVHQDPTWASRALKIGDHVQARAILDPRGFDLPHYVAIGTIDEIKPPFEGTCPGGKQTKIYPEQYAVATVDGRRYWFERYELMPISLIELMAAAAAAE